MNYLVEIAGRVCFITGIFSLFCRLYVGRKAILIFHNPSVRSLSSHVNFLSRYVEFYSGSFEEFILHRHQGTKPSVFITFDDGYSSYRKLNEYLESKGIGRCFYITLDSVSGCRPFWWQQCKSKKEIKKLKRLKTIERLQYLKKIYDWPKNQKNINNGCSRTNHQFSIDDIKAIGCRWIGAHTVTHPILSRCSDAESLFEIEHSIKTLGGWSGGKIQNFAYPNGGVADFSDREMQFLSDQKIKYARSTRYGFLAESLSDLESDTSLRLNLPGILMPDTGSRYKLIFYFMGFRRLAKIPQSLLSRILSIANGKIKS